jgi:hypothetical protein
MISLVGKSSIASRRTVARASAALALAGLLAGCGSTLKDGLAASASVALGPSSSVTHSCAQTALDTLGGVVRRVYHEGVESERTAAAISLLESSAALREAVETDDAAAARVAARALLASGHLSNLQVVRGTRTLVAVGGPALAPLKGTLLGASGEPIANYTLSVWSDSAFAIEANGLTEGDVALRMHGRSVGGSLALGDARLAEAGTLTRDHVLYQYASFLAESYPSGSLRVYLLRSVRSTNALCGHTSEDTVVNALRRVANVIYDDEVGPVTQPQVRRVQHDRPLLEAVARREPEATRLAIDKLLNQHIVRLRVSVGGQLLADVGGPFVLAPVKAALKLGGHKIGGIVLSIQDDEGYLRLTRRLAGLDVLMYDEQADPQLVKNSLGPEPGTVPAEGSYTYRGKDFRVFTIHAEAFPSGPLLIRVLVPIPYPTPAELAAELAHAGASDSRLARRASRRSWKEAANFSTPSRSSVSVTSP